MPSIKFKYASKKKYPKSTKPVDKKQDKQIKKLIKQNKSEKSFRYELITGKYTKTWSDMLINEQKILINGLSQGAGGGQRLGDIITMSHLSIRLQIETYLSEDADQIFHPVRIMLVVDKCPNAAEVPRDSLLLSPVGANSNTNAFLGPLNPDHRGDYRVLYDKTYSFNTQSSFYDSLTDQYIPSQTSQEIRINKKLNDMEVQYVKGTTNGSIDNFASNALWLFIFSRYNNGCAYNINYKLDYSQ